VTKDQILAALPKLKKTDLQAVQAVCANLLGQAPKNAPAAKPSPAEAMLFDALTLTIGVKMGFQAFSQLDTYRHWRNHAPEALGFIEANFSNDLGTNVPMKAFHRFLIGLLIDDMKRRHIPITLQSVVVNLSRLPEVYQDSFPGYLGSANHLIIAAMIKRNSKNGKAKRNDKVRALQRERLD